MKTTFRKTRNKAGFTLMELLVALMIIGLLVFIPTVVLCGNQWYTHQGVIKELRYVNPDVLEVLSSKICLVQKSEFYVRLQDGTKKTYFLDSNILFNYKFTTE